MAPSHALLGPVPDWISSTASHSSWALRCSALIPAKGSTHWRQELGKTPRGSLSGHFHGIPCPAFHNETQQSYPNAYRRLGGLRAGISSQSPCPLLLPGPVLLTPDMCGKGLRGQRGLLRLRGVCRLVIHGLWGEGGAGQWKALGFSRVRRAPKGGPSGFQGGLRKPKCTQGSPGLCETYPKGSQNDLRGPQGVAKSPRCGLRDPQTPPARPGGLKGPQRVPSAAQEVSRCLKGPCPPPVASTP